MCDDLVGFDEVESLDIGDSIDTEIETLDFDDSTDTEIELLDFDDSTDTEIETLDFDESIDTEIESSDYNEETDFDIETPESVSGDIQTEPDDQNYIDDNNFSDTNESADIGETIDNPYEISDNDLQEILLDNEFDSTLESDVTYSDMNIDPEDSIYGLDVLQDNYVDADDFDEDNGYAYTLNRDPNELLQSGYDAVNDELAVMEDQYRNEGMSESEIADRLQQDKLELQQNFLNDAFPGQDVSPEVFNQFDDADSTSDIAAVNDVDEWLGEINPNFDEFDPESPYCNNCGSCAYAVYQRLQGDSDICATAENIGYNDQMEALTGMKQVPMSPDEIEHRLLSEGNGANAIIGIDRSSGPGHWFNAACIDGKVVAIDGQTGEITDWPPDYGDVVNWEMSVKQ